MLGETQGEAWKAVTLGWGRRPEAADRQGPHREAAIPGHGNDHVHTRTSRAGEREAMEPRERRARSGPQARDPGGWAGEQLIRAWRERQGKGAPGVCFIQHAQLLMSDFSVPVIVQGPEGFERRTSLEFNI